jgi:hypothetical protein
MPGARRSIVSLRPRRTRAVIAICLAIAACLAATPALASVLPSGERHTGKVTIEPAYDDATGTLIYLATPDKSPFPTISNWHSVAPLYLVVYPPSASNLGPFNCAGDPGNCPDHSGLFANMATALYPAVYGTDPTAVPGHDHLVAAPASGGDFNVAWQVIPVLFTGTGPVTHITTEAALEAAGDAGYVVEEPPVVTFTCAVVSEASYLVGTPVGD